jgi:hypothetical protein
MVAQLVKQNKCIAHPAALQPFLQIRFDEVGRCRLTLSNPS